MIHRLTDHLLKHWEAIVGDLLPRPRRLSWMKFGSVADFPRRYTYLYAFPGNSSEPALVVKVTADRAAQARLVREFDLLGRIRARVDPEIAATIPRALAGLPFGAYWVGVEETAGGERFLPVVGLDKRSTRRRVERYCERVLDWLTRFARSGSGRCELTPDRWNRVIAEPLARLRSFHTLEKHESRYLEELVARLEDYRGQEITTVATHGDLWPGNIFVRRDRLRVIDWTDFRARDITYHDVFTFLDSFVVREGGIAPPAHDVAEVENRRSLLTPVGPRNWLHHLAASFFDRYLRALDLDRRLATLMVPFYYVTMATRRDPVSEASIAVNRKFRVMLGRYITLAVSHGHFGLLGPFDPNEGAADETRGGGILRPGEPSN